MPLKQMFDVITNGHNVIYRKATQDYAHLTKAAITLT